MLFHIIMLPNIWCSFSGLKHCASFVDRFLIKPFLLFFFGLNLILNQFMIIYDSCVHVPTTSDVFFQVRGLALFSSFGLLLLLLVCFFPSLYLGNGSKQTNIVIYGAH